VQAYFTAARAEIPRMGPADFGTLMMAETAKWERVVKEGRIKTG
jgi:hypothetical protein